MKTKVKCHTQEEYEQIKIYMDSIGVDYRQKEGKSLKLDCNENELSYHLRQLDIHPVSIKPCKQNNITGYQAVNRGDGQGLQTEYSLQSDLHQILPPIYSKDDYDTYKALMDLRDPSGLTRAVFEHSKKRFNFDFDEYDEYVR
jgi:hypothetical protein